MNAAEQSLGVLIRTFITVIPRGSNERERVGRRYVPWYTADRSVVKWIPMCNDWCWIEPSSDLFEVDPNLWY